MEEVRISKQALLESKKYRHLVDVIMALFEDGNTYTQDEIDNVLSPFMKER